MPIREDRAKVLEALRDATGTFGDSLSAPRVEAFVQDPAGASIKEFGYVSGLFLPRFYGGASEKPNKADRAVLWNAIMIRFDQAGTADPGGWGPQSSVSQLHRIVDEAIA